MSSGANINNFRCEQEICGLLWTMYALFCFDGFVRAMLEDIEAFCTRPQNELGFCFLKIWVNIIECVCSWNNFYSTNGRSFRAHDSSEIQSQIVYVMNVSFHLWVNLNGKNMFLSNIQKSKHHIRIKIKTWYQPPKEVLHLKLSLYLTRSVSRMKCLHYFRYCFLM